MSLDVIIRPLIESDRPQWAALWSDYLAFYETTLPTNIYDSTFARLLGDDPQDFSGLVAERNGELIGLTHYLFHRHGWKVENVCYLQDLYVTPSARGTGSGRKLIEAVYAAADANNAPNVYWMTQDNNVAGRQLYDRVGTLTNFIKYQRPTS
jgi:GNAT superfamily N-acetyltransferase